MFEQLGFIGTIRDEDESPEELDTESEQEVSEITSRSGDPNLGRKKLCVP